MKLSISNNGTITLIVGAYKAIKFTCVLRENSVNLTLKTASQSH